jgi:hypothetical protein
MHKTLPNDAWFNTQNKWSSRQNYQFTDIIYLDGWEDVVRWPLLNIMQICPVGDVFLGSIDTINSTKGANYVATEIKRYIAEVDQI